MKIERTAPLPSRRPNRRRKTAPKRGADSSLHGTEKKRAEEISPASHHDQDAHEAEESGLDREAALELATTVGQMLAHLTCPIGQHHDPRTLRMM